MFNQKSVNIFALIKKSLSLLSLLSMFAWLLSAYNPLSVQAGQNFALRYQTTEKGDIGLFGNTLMKCNASSTGCSDALNGTGSGNVLSNNAHTMTYVDVDSDSNTFNSSSYTFSAPTGSSLLWAGLYWGGATANSSRNTAKLKIPGSNSYTTVTSTSLYNLSSSEMPYYTRAYQGFTEITSLLSSNSSNLSGTYWVANVQSDTTVDVQAAPYAGWSIVMIYQNNSMLLKNMTVFDGLTFVGANNPNPITQNISGFSVPSSGAFSTKVGLVTYEGDLGTTGDSFKVNTTTISNGVNASSNFFNSTISDSGSHLTTKNPNYPNQLGFDIDTMDATSALSNGATNANLVFQTSGDAFYPGVATFVTSTVEPRINITSSVTDLNNGTANPGDILEYTVNISNDGNDNATGVSLTNFLPKDVDYIGESIRILTGANAGAKTDQASDDQATFNSEDGEFLIRLGSNASSSYGGTLAPGATTSLRYRVQIKSAANDNAMIALQSEVMYTKQTTGTVVSDFSDDSSWTGNQPSSVTVLRSSAASCTGNSADVGSGANNANALTAVSLCLTGGGLSLFAGDSNSNNDICSPANITDFDEIDTTITGQIPTQIFCTEVENSIALTNLSVKSNRQNTTSVVQDMVWEDLRGLTSTGYTLAATVTDFSDGQQAISLGSNPDGASSDTDSNAPSGQNANKIFAYLDCSGCNINVLRSTAARNQGTTNYQKGAGSTVVNTTTPVTVISTGEDIVPGRVSISNMLFKLRIPAYVKRGNYQGNLVLTIS